MEKIDIGPLSRRSNRSPCCNASFGGQVLAQALRPPTGRCRIATASPTRSTPTSCARGADAPDPVPGRTTRDGRSLLRAAGGGRPGRPGDLPHGLLVPRSPRRDSTTPTRSRSACRRPRSARLPPRCSGRAPPGAAAFWEAGVGRTGPGSPVNLQPSMPNGRPNAARPAALDARPRPMPDDPGAPPGGPGLRQSTSRCCRSARVPHPVEFVVAAHAGRVDRPLDVVPPSGPGRRVVAVRPGAHRRRPEVWASARAGSSPSGRLVASCAAAGPDPVVDRTGR